MRKSFAATLHNNTEKTQNPANVLLQPGRIHIESGGENLDWLAGDLNSTRLLNDGSVIVQNGPLFLEVLEPGFDRALEHYLGSKKLFRRSFFDKIGLAGCLVAILVILLPLLAVFFWLAPAVAEGAADKISPETEQQIGDSWYQSLTANYTIDSSKTRLVQQFYDSLRYGSNYPIRITVVQEPVVNAFAVPGGHIVVFDSIIGIMDVPEQLAGLLAHEVSHIQLKHSTRAIFRELANQLLISLIFGDYGSVSGIVAQHSSQLAGLSYSRSLEIEADLHGFELMKKSSIPLRGMPDLFRKMKVTAPAAPEVPNFLSTHPALEERIASAEKQIQQNKRPGDTLPPALLDVWKELKK